MQITLTNAGKRYNREWIFRHFSHTFLSGKKYAITGPNGSGKSTLLQVVSGSLTFNEGEILLTENGKSVANELLYLHVTMAAPYLELIEEMSANEFLTFHSTFKKLTLSNQAMLEMVQLGSAAHKQIRYFSSGMKQRLKLAQAFFSETSVLLLDEPTTNLDAEGAALYKNLIQQHSKDKLVIICSNDPLEYDFCDEVISISDYK